MPRKIGVVVFAAFVLASSYVVGWFGTGGSATPLELTDSRVEAATQFLTPNVSSYRTLMKAWTRETPSGFEVSVGYRTGTGLWLTTAEFDSAGVAISDQTKTWTGMLLPGYLRTLSYIFFFLWPITAFVAPHFFAVKCPDCPGNFFNPALTEVEESTVYGGGYDQDGHDLSAIARRDYVCSRCGYRKITFYSDPPHSGGFGRARPITHSLSAGMNLNPKEMDWYEKVVGKYLSDHKGGKDLRFPTYEDWKAFLDELKASEREERRSAT